MQRTPLISYQDTHYQTGHNSTEKIIKQVVSTEYAVVLSRFREETEKDQQLQALTKRIKHGDWEKHKKDLEKEPFYAIREDLCIAEGLISDFQIREDCHTKQLTAKLVKAAHSL